MSIITPIVFALTFGTLIGCAIVRGLRKLQ